jgi:hypothetical protein
MIEVKEAVQIARQYLQDAIENIQLLQLEETELVEDEKYWIITLSYIPGVFWVGLGMEARSLHPLQNAKFYAAVQQLRNYKTFKINRSTGKVEAMKVRTFEQPA